MRHIFDIYPIKGDINISREKLLNCCFCFTIEPSTIYDIELMLDFIAPFIKSREWAYYLYDRDSGSLDYFKTKESLKIEIVNSFIYKL